jgi:hypothetical protein
MSEPVRIEVSYENREGSHQDAHARAAGNREILQGSPLDRRSSTERSVQSVFQSMDRWFKREVFRPMDRMFGRVTGQNQQRLGDARNARNARNAAFESAAADSANAANTQAQDWWQRHQGAHGQAAGMGSGAAAAGGGGNRRGGGGGPGAGGGGGRGGRGAGGGFSFGSIGSAGLGKIIAGSAVFTLTNLILVKILSVLGDMFSLQERASDLSKYSAEINLQQARRQVAEIRRDVSASQGPVGDILGDPKRTDVSIALDAATDRVIDKFLLILAPIIEMGSYLLIAVLQILELLMLLLTPVWAILYLIREILRQFTRLGRWLANPFRDHNPSALRSTLQIDNFMNAFTGMDVNLDTKEMKGVDAFTRHDPGDGGGDPRADASGWEWFRRTFLGF